MTNFKFELPKADRHDDPFQSIYAMIFAAVMIPLLTWRLWVPAFKLFWWLVSGVAL